MYINYETALAPAQYAVVQQHEGPILCVACPGSGKTHTLVYRAAHMIQNGIAPENILLLTFTRKAAKEIKDRISRLIGPAAHGIMAGTFHSVALRLLRKHYTLLGFESVFSVMASGDMTVLMRMIREDAKTLVPDGVTLPAAAELLSTFSAIRNRYEDMEEAIHTKYPEMEEEDYTEDSESENPVFWIYQQYRDRKRRMCLVDYDDLMFGLRHILETKPALRAVYGNKFRYIMVDEFQDTNPVQKDITLMLAEEHENLMVVGDESQSIYAFRGATIENILTIREHFSDMTVMLLEENHRSGDPIVKILNTTLTHAKKKIPKVMRSVQTQYTMMPTIATPKTGIGQAEYVTQSIINLHRGGVPYHEIAVLFRNSYHSNMVDLFLTRNQIPFVRSGGVKFTEAAHVLDILAFLKIRLNKYDRVSWRRVLTMLPGLGPVAVEKILSAIFPDEQAPLSFDASTHSQEPWELLMDFGGKNNYIPFLHDLGSLLTNIDVLGDITETFNIIFEYYEPFCRTLYKKDFEFRQKALGQLLEMAARYENAAVFLDDFATEDAMPSETDGEDVPDQVDLSTIHSSKGREWLYVFVIELVEGALPSHRNLDDEEELRLFYVACSRAKEGLFLVSPQTYKDLRTGREGRTQCSRFLERVQKGLIRSIT